MLPHSTSLLQVENGKGQRALRSKALRNVCTEWHKHTPPYGAATRDRRAHMGSTETLNTDVIYNYKVRRQRKKVIGWGGGSILGRGEGLAHA